MTLWKDWNGGSKRRRAGEGPARDGEGGSHVEWSVWTGVTYQFYAFYVVSHLVLPTSNGSSASNAARPLIPVCPGEEGGKIGFTYLVVMRLSYMPTTIGLMESCYWGYCYYVKMQRILRASMTFRVVPDVPLAVMAPDPGM